MRGSISDVLVHVQVRVEGEAQALAKKRFEVFI